MKTLRVELGDRSYAIEIGDGLLARPELFAPLVTDRRVMVVTNETVAPFYLERLLHTLGSFEAESVILADGEEYKTFETVNVIVDALLRARFGRDCTLVALGGGVVGDVAGFTAACYQRGVAYIQVPTTLLAQVDSAVGGKTAVNHRLGKNMIGAFHQPVGVITDTDTLHTLDDRQLAAGVAEVIKYGLIRDAPFFEWLEGNIDAVLARRDDALIECIYRSCHNKAEIVSLDEREAGVRALLNLGHTFAHAIETGLDYRGWLHGEAVAAGMCLAARLSARLGWLGEGAHERIEALVHRAGLPADPPSELGAERMLELMAVDKKGRGGRLRLVLLAGLGRGVVSEDFDPVALREVLDATPGGR